MPPLTKRSMAIPSGMLAPNGYRQSAVSPVIQATTRPAGTLLRESPGYNSIRVGKNRFQGKGPSGGFREMEYAEDVGGTGGALSVVPGDVQQIAASEWLNSDDPNATAGAMIIADRGRAQDPTFAERLHEAYSTLPDMGDRHPGRPRTMSHWLVNPVNMFRKDFRESPAITVVATGALLFLINRVARDLETQYRSRSRGGVASEATAIPASGAATVGDTAASAIDEIGKTGDKVVAEIESAGKDAVNAIKDTAQSVTP